MLIQGKIRQVFKQTKFIKTPTTIVRFVVAGIFSFCILNVTLAQKQTVKGVVKDNNGELMIGVSVVIKGTTNCTITNFNGQYAVDVNSGKDVLLFSYVGYNNFYISQLTAK